MKIDLTQYKTLDEKLAYLVKNKKDLIEFKRASVKFADSFGISPFELNFVKAINTNFTDDIASGIIKRSLILNTYNWMDSHNDVHAKSVFSKSITERKDKIWHLHDHEYKITAKVGTPTRIYEKEINWTDLGVSKTGITQSLFMDSEISKEMNPMIFREYVENKINQHSVSMRYIKIDLAVNDPQYKEEFATWENTIHLLGNPQKAEENGFYWFVKEAMLIEGSAVLEGSNELTPTIVNQPDNNKSVEVTIEQQPKKLNLNYLIENFKL